MSDTGQLQSIASASHLREEAFSGEDSGSNQDPKTIQNSLKEFEASFIAQAFPLTGFFKGMDRASIFAIFDNLQLVPNLEGLGILNSLKTGSAVGISTKNNSAGGRGGK